MNERRIFSHDCVAEGVDWLVRQDPRWQGAVAHAGPLPLRLNPEGFAELQRIIMGQQVSVASADAVQRKLEAAGMDDPDTVLSASDAALRGLGLSRQKVRYVKALAAADIDYAGLRRMPADMVVATLTAVPGIGRWTADIYLMFSLGRADAFAPGDLALQEAARMIFDLPARPDEKALRGMSMDWSPWRSVAARIMWAYYMQEKQREGIR